MLRWSRHARIYQPSDVLLRHPFDPSAASVPIGRPGQRAIDCILSHTTDATVLAAPDADAMRFDVHNQLYNCRLLFADAPATHSNIVNLTYEAVQHSLAMDNYAICTPQLTGHRSIANMPLAWNPRIVPSSQHPMHVPELADERDLPLDDDLSEDPNQFDF